jgi:DNA-binding transcriptional MerR regulator
MSRIERSVVTARIRSPVTVLRVIKAAQRRGFTLDEAADLLEVSRLRAGQRTDEGLQARARVKLDEVDAKLVELHGA